MNWWTQNGLVDPIGSNIEELREIEYYKELELELELEEEEGDDDELV